MMCGYYTILLQCVKFFVLFCIIFVVIYDFSIKSTVFFVKMSKKRNISSFVALQHFCVLIIIALNFSHLERVVNCQLPIKIYIFLYYLNRENSAFLGL